MTRANVSKFSTSRHFEAEARAHFLASHACRTKRVSVVAFRAFETVLVFTVNSGDSVCALANRFDTLIVAVQSVAVVALDTLVSAMYTEKLLKLSFKKRKLSFRGYLKTK